MSLYLVYRQTSKGEIIPWSTRKDLGDARKDKRECFLHHVKNGNEGTIAILEIPYIDEIARVAVSDHAIDRYRERTGCRADRSDSYVRKRIRSFWEAGKPAVLAPQYRVTQIMRHGDAAEYRLYDQIVLVMVADEIKTIHFNESKRWVVKG